jgi:hypothetical protein
MPSLIFVSFLCQPVMQITFPVLQEAETGSKARNHWYTLCLNIEAEDLKPSTLYVVKAAKALLSMQMP